MNGRTSVTVQFEFAREYGYDIIGVSGFQDDALVWLVWSSLISRFCEGGCHVFQHKETCCILLSQARSAWWLETWRNLWNVCMQSWLKVFNRDSSSTLVEILRFFPCRGLSGCLCYLMLSYVVCLILSYCRPEVQQWHLAFGEGLWWNWLECN